VRHRFLVQGDVLVSLTTLYIQGDHIRALHIVACLLTLDLVEHHLITRRRPLVSCSLQQYPLEHPEMVQRHPHCMWANRLYLPVQQQAASSHHLTKIVTHYPFKADFTRLVSWTFDNQRWAQTHAIYLPTVSLLVPLSHSPLQQQPLP
jgi:hypothetical protein